MSTIVLTLPEEPDARHNGAGCCLADGTNTGDLVPVGSHPVAGRRDDREQLPDASASILPVRDDKIGGDRLHERRELLATVPPRTLRAVPSHLDMGALPGHREALHQEGVAFNSRASWQPEHGSWKVIEGIDLDGDDLDVALEFTGDLFVRTVF